MIKGQGIAKSFGDFKAIRDLHIHVEKGSVYGLVGPNGAGKTTLIKMLNGIIRPDAGEIKIDGQAVWENEALKERLIYVSDDLYFFSMATLRDLAQLYAGIYPRWNARRFEKLKEAFPIEEKTPPDPPFQGNAKAGGLLAGPLCHAGCNDSGRTGRRTGSGDAPPGLESDAAGCSGKGDDRPGFLS